MGKTRKFYNIPLFPKLTILVFTLLLLFLPFTTSNAELKTPLFVFGDSLFDTGMNLYSGLPGSGARYWPYGQNYFNKPSGRYCDGRVIPDFIAQFAGLKLPDPFLLPGIDNFTQGISFAAAGACTLVEVRPGTIGLAQQLVYFANVAERLKYEIGEKEAFKLLSRAVYIFNIGGNDYFTLFDNNKDNLPISPAVKRDYMNKMLGNFTTYIQKIYKLGGRKFAYFNIGPMGCMPAVRFLLGLESGCQEELQELVRMHNVKLVSLSKRLKKRLPGFTYSIYDFYTSLYVRILHGNKFGFKESEIACCGSGPYNGDYSCQKMERSFSVCSTPSDYLWFDAGHTTQRANEQFAKEMWDGGPRVIAPYNLRTLFSMKN